MGKKLAIKGHPTRGKEVIELLEMMGGINSDEAYGNLPNNWNVSYYIFKDGIIKVSEDKILIKKQFEIFTLEEFLSKYPFKVGDKIPDVWGNSCTVKSMSWDENYKTVMYGFKETTFVARGDEMYLTNVVNNAGLKIEKNMNTGIEFDLTKYDYEVKDGKLVISEKKPLYPKLTNLTECKEILGERDMYQSVSGYKGEILTNFQLLLIFRDVYWKIAGEQMGLGKPWEPDLENEELYCIQNYNKQITISRTNTAFNKILIFPTAEMRDTFYKNFKDLIEQCKELL